MECHLHARVNCGFVAPSVPFRLSVLEARTDKPLSNLRRLLLLILSTIVPVILADQRCTRVADIADIFKTSFVPIPLELERGSGGMGPYKPGVASPLVSKMSQRI